MLLTRYEQIHDKADKAYWQRERAEFNADDDALDIAFAMAITTALRECAEIAESCPDAVWGPWVAGRIRNVLGGVSE